MCLRGIEPRLAVLQTAALPSKLETRNDICSFLVGAGHEGYTAVLIFPTRANAPYLSIYSNSIVTFSIISTGSFSEMAQISPVLGSKPNAAIREYPEVLNMV